MVGKVIRDYMEGGAKKLTVPGFGTFMRRDEAGVIFVDLLRGDDGVLREMVEDAGGYSEVEAMALIDRFIFETKTAIDRHGNISIDGFGVMTLDPKGVYQFEYSPKARPVEERAVQERLFEKDPPPPQATQSPAPQPVSPRAEQPHAEVRRDPSPRSETRQSGRIPQSGRPGRKPHGKKSSRTDTVLIVAIIAAAIALVALIFGMSSAGMPFLQR